MSSDHLKQKLNTKKIYEEEEEDNFVFSIREEIIGKVFTEIGRYEQDADTLQFVVDCAVEALRRVVTLQFYYHKEIPDPRHPSWCPDEPIPPSPPDSWACNVVSIRKSQADLLARSSEVVETSSSEREPCPCDLGVECLCWKENVERIQALMKEIDKPVRGQKSIVSQRSPSISSSEGTRVMSDEESPASEESSNSEETVLPPVLEKESEKKVVIKSVLKKDNDLFKLPKIESRTQALKRVDESIMELELPPIR
ncbi:hypothetical protein NQ315_015984 [Exocentrus adspersus]|uniref:Uncharacterized protein n=1 Tax=Exocentrus adspersus TaxID=1586481 RepID=A0AAV8VLT7_9CUCU|nr:hypothetical protein NQ315_015984 [Exocentrus adspersus]